MTSILVYAVGNPLRGDDGIGPAVIEHLRSCISDPNVEFVDGGTSGLEAALEFKNRSRIILIDAAELDAAPGTVRKLTLNAEELATRPVHPNSLHSAGLLEALALASTLGALPSRITLFGVQPQSLNYETVLSQEVQAAIPELVAGVLEAISEPD